MTRFSNEGVRAFNFARPYTVSVILILVSFCVLAEVKAATEQDLIDALLGEKSYSEQELNDMDINLDGVVDVADIVAFLQGSNGPLPVGGYKWLISASFNADTGIGAIPFTYNFLLDVLPGPDINPIPDTCDQSNTDNLAFVDSLREFDPTQAILDQNLSEPGEVSGAHRPNYEPGRIVPWGTMFCKAELADVLILTSENVLVPANEPSNPTGKDLYRSWVIEVQISALEEPTLIHGTIVESLHGYLPGNVPLITSGTVFLTRYEPHDLGTIELP